MLCILSGWTSPESCLAQSKVDWNGYRREYNRQIDAYYRNKAEASRQQAEADRNVAGVERSNAEAASQAVSQAHYNHTEGTERMMYEAEAAKSERRLRQSESDKGYSPRIPSSMRGGGADMPQERLRSRSDMAAAVTGSVNDSPIPSGGHHIADFKRWEREHSHPFKPLSREELRTRRVEVPADKNILTALGEHRTADAAGMEPAGEETDAHITVLQQIQQTDSGVVVNVAYDIYDEPLVLQMTPEPDLYVHPQPDFPAMPESDTSETELPERSREERLRLLDSVSDELTRELRKKINTIQMLFDINAVCDAEISLNLADVRNDFQHIVVRAVDFNSSTVPGLIVSQSISETLHELADFDDAEFRKYYGIEERRSLNPTADMLKKSRDAVETVVAANGVIPGVQAASIAALFKKVGGLGTVLMNAPEIGTSIGSACAAIMIYRDKRENLKKCQEYKTQILELGERLTAIEKEKETYLNLGASAAHEQDDSEVREKKMTKPKRFMKSASGM